MKRTEPSQWAVPLQSSSPAKLSRQNRRRQLELLLLLLKFLGLQGVSHREQQLALLALLLLLPLPLPLLTELTLLLLLLLLLLLPLAELRVSTRALLVVVGVEQIRQRRRAVGGECQLHYRWGRFRDLRCLIQRSCVVIT